MIGALKDVLGNSESEARSLDHHGHRAQAQTILDLCAAVRLAAVELLTELSEAQAMEYSGRSAEYLKARFVAWQARGLARLDDAGRRWYCRCVLEHRGNADAARAAGRRAAGATT